MAEIDHDGAFPHVTHGGIHDHQVYAPGLTKREYFAAMALPTAFKVYEAGYTGEPKGEETMPILVASVACEMADALIAQLAKTTLPVSGCTK